MSLSAVVGTQPSAYGAPVPTLALIPPGATEVAAQIAAGAGLTLSAGGLAAVAGSLVALGVVLTPANGWASFAEASRATLNTYRDWHRLSPQARVLAIHRYAHILSETPPGPQRPDQVRAAVEAMLSRLVKDSEPQVQSGRGGQGPRVVPAAEHCSAEGFGSQILQRLQQINPQMHEARQGQGPPNCVACAISADVLLRTGVFSQAPVQGGALARGLIERLYQTAWQPGGPSLNTVARYFRAPGSTGLVLFDGRFTQHVFNVFNDCGKVHFFDPQTGRLVDDRMFEGEYGGFWFIRTR